MDPIQLASEVLNQAQAMNTAAKDNNWSKVQEIQPLHNNTVAQLAVVKIDNEQHANNIRKLLIEAKALNQQTEQLAAERKNSLVKEKQTMNKANKMQKALDALK